MTTRKLLSVISVNLFNYHFFFFPYGSSTSLVWRLLVGLLHVAGFFQMSGGPWLSLPGWIMLIEMQEYLCTSKDFWRYTNVSHMTSFPLGRVGGGWPPCWGSPKQPNKDGLTLGLSSGHRTGKGQFSFQSQRKAMPKNAQTTAQLHSSHTLIK